MWEVSVGTSVWCGCETKEDADAVVRFLVRSGYRFVFVRFNPDVIF